MLNGDVFLVVSFISGGSEAKTSMIEFMLVYQKASFIKINQMQFWLFAMVGSPTNYIFSHFGRCDPSPGIKCPSFCIKSFQSLFIINFFFRIFLFMLHCISRHYVLNKHMAVLQQIQIFMNCLRLLFEILATTVKHFCYIVQICIK